MASIIFYHTQGRLAARRSDTTPHRPRTARGASPPAVHGRCSFVFFFYFFFHLTCSSYILVVLLFFNVFFHLTCFSSSSTSFSSSSSSYLFFFCFFLLFSFSSSSWVCPCLYDFGESGGWVGWVGHAWVFWMSVGGAKLRKRKEEKEENRAQAVRRNEEHICRVCPCLYDFGESAFLLFLAEKGKGSASTSAMTAGVVATTLRNIQKCAVSGFNRWSQLKKKQPASQPALLAN